MFSRVLVWDEGYSKIWKLGIMEATCPFKQGHLSRYLMGFFRRDIMRSYFATRFQTVGIIQKPLQVLEV